MFSGAGAARDHAIQFARIGHNDGLHRSGRTPDGRPIHRRIDGPGFDAMDTTDGRNTLKLQFSAFLPSADFFAILRRNVGAVDLLEEFNLAEEDHGLERFLTATRRQNFLIPHGGTGRSRSSSCPDPLLRGAGQRLDHPQPSAERGDSELMDNSVTWRRDGVSSSVDPEAVGLEAMPTLTHMQVDLVAIVVEDYDPAIKFFVDALGFDLVEDSPSLTNDGRPKRWVVVRPPGGQTGLLLARADGEHQATAMGNQVAGRVGFFLRVDDFGAAFERMNSVGVEFVSSPRTEPYGRVAVFLDIAGNRWDLLGPA